MKKTLIISTLLLSSVSIVYAATVKISDKDRETFYNTIFRAPSSDMFVDNSNGITINGNKIGQFKSGTSGMTTYLDFYDTFREINKNKDLYKEKALAEYAGLPLYQKGHDEDYSFGHYNPDLIKWGINNLYITPNTQIYGVKAQDIYNNSFRRYFRLTTEAYLYLNKKKGLYKTEQNKYIGEYNKTLKDEEYVFFGPEYLDLKYSKLGVFKQYNDENFTYTPGVAVGFWLRRGLDKTDKVVWSGLKKVMTNYDKEWFKKVSK